MPSHSVMSDSLWPMGFSLPSSAHEILQTRILGWVAIPFFRVSSQARYWIQGSNQAILHCRQILYHLSHQGSPYSLLRPNNLPLHLNTRKLQLVPFMPHVYNHMLNFTYVMHPTVFFFFGFFVCFCFKLLAVFFKVKTTKKKTCFLYIIFVISCFHLFRSKSY